MKDNYQQTLYDFNATIAAHPEYNDSTLLEKFPEFGGDMNKLKAAFDYSATMQSGKYADDIDRLNAMFPEFFGQTDSVEVPSKQNSKAESIPTITLQPQEHIAQPESTLVNNKSALPDKHYSIGEEEQVLNTAQQQKGFWRNPIGDVLEKLGEGVLNIAGGLGKLVDKFGEGMRIPITEPGDYMPDNIRDAVNRGEYRQENPNIGGKILEAAQVLSERGDFHGMVKDPQTGEWRKKDYKDLWKEGKPFAALGEIMLTATASAPTSLVAMVPGGLGIVSASAVGQKYHELEANPETEDMPEWKKWLNASVSGAIEGATEKLGAKVDKLAFEPFLEKMTEETVKGILRKGGVNALIQTVTEGLEESIGQMGENIVDYATGVNDTYSPFEGVGDAFVYGAGGGSQFGAATFSMSGYRAYQQRNYEKGGAKVVEDMKTKVINDIINPPLIEDIDINNPAFPASSKLQLLKAKEAMDAALDGHEFTFDHNMADLSEAEQKQVIGEVLNSEDLSDEQKQAIANYMTTANVERQIQEMQEQAYQQELERDAEEVRANTNQDTGTFVQAEVKGIVDSEGKPAPVIILRGLLFNEDGEVDTENSSGIIYYKESSQGETKTTSIEHIGDVWARTADEVIGNMQQMTTEMQQRMQGEIDKMVNQWMIQEMVDEMNPEGPIDVENETVEDTGNESGVIDPIPEQQNETTLTPEQQAPEITPEQQAELEAEQIKQEFLSSLPVHEKGANVGEIDQSKMSAEQTIQFFEYTYGPEKTLSAAQAQVKNLQKNLEKEKAKLDKNPFNIAQNEKVANVEAELKSYSDYVNTKLLEATEQRMQENQTSLVEDAAQKEAEIARVKEEQRIAQMEAEATQGVPDMSVDTAEKARNRGFRVQSGVKIDRAQPIEITKSTDRTRKFKDGHEVEVKRTIVEADQLHPSHKAGTVNPMHFIAEGQPKNRTDEASKMARESIATKINPEEITGGVTAYTGAPVANQRGEIIQGNGRTDGLQAMYKGHPESAAKYKQYLADTASDYGMTAEEVMSMNNPVAVDITLTDDARSVELGQFTASDTESGGVQRISAQHAAVGLGDNMATFSSMLFNTQNEDMSMSEVIEMNGKKALEYLYNKGLLNDTQYQSAFDAKGNLTPEVKTDLQNISAHLLFNKASDNMQQMFALLPDKARKSILQTIHRDLDSAESDRITGEIRDAIEAYYHLQQHPEFSSLTKYEDLRTFAEQARNQKQMFNSETELPLQKYSNFAMELALLFKTDKQNTLRRRFNTLYDNLQGKGGDMFNEAIQLPLAEAVKNNFNNINYVPNNKQIQRTIVGRDDTAGKTGQQTGTGNIGSGEQNQAGAGTTDSGGGTIGTTQPVSSRTERIGELTAAFDNATTLQEKAEIARQLNEQYSELFGVDDVVEVCETVGDFVEEFSERVKESFPSIAEDAISKLNRDISRGGIFPGVEIGGRVLINTEHNINSTELSKTWLHEQTHIADTKVFSPEQKENADIPNIDNHVPRAYHEDNKRVKFSEAIAHAVEGLLESHTIEQIAQGEADLSGVHEDIRKIVSTTLKQLTNGTSKNSISRRHNENAHDATQGISGSVLRKENSKHERPGSNGSDSANQRRAKPTGKERQPGESIADYANRVSQNNQIADAGKMVDPNPTEAQKKAGNYQKGHVKVGGFDITIENPAGSERSGTDESGKPWSITMNNHYGYFKLTKAVDGDHVDVFIGNNPNSEKVFVIDQVNPDTKQFDENKVMLGFDTAEQAREAYLSNYEEGWQGMGTMTEVDIETFRDWLYRGTKQQKPFSQYKAIHEEGATVSSIEQKKTETQRKPGESIADYARRVTELNSRFRKVEKQQHLDKLNAELRQSERNLDKLKKEHGKAYRRYNELSNKVKNDPSLGMAGQGLLFEAEPAGASMLDFGNADEALSEARSVVRDAKAKADELGRKVNEASKDVERKKEEIVNTTFNQQLLFRKQVSEINQVKNGLVALHNISENNLLHTTKTGMLPMPSIAVTKADIPFTGFGEITLIGGKGLIDPQADRRNKVWSADAYTVRYPNVRRTVGKEKALIKYSSKLPAEIARQAVHDIAHSVENGGLSELMEDRNVQYQFLKENGNDVTAYREAPHNEAITELIRGHDAYDWHLLSDKELLRKELTPLYIQELADKGMKDEGRLKDLYLAEDGLIDEHFAENAYNSTRRYIRDIDRGDKIDTYTTLRNARENIYKNGEFIEGYQEYVKDLYESLGVQEKIFNGYTPSGNPRLIANTPENALKIMLKERGAAKENASGVGKIVASESKTFKSTDQMKEHSENIKGREAHEEAREQLNGKFLELSNTISDKYKGNNIFNQLDDLIDEMGDIARKGQSQMYNKVSPEAQTLAQEIIAMAKNAPVQYFEGKPERMVYMSEFAVAIIPHYTSNETKQALEQAGISFREYSDNESRVEAVKKASEDMGLRFRKTYTEIADIKEKAIADGTFMKAPNGKDTNLTEHQWLQTRTEAFKEWFGESKLIDENGEPIVTTHSSQNKFNTFDTDKIGSATDSGAFGQGFYFSTHEHSAYGNNVYETFLKVDNPLILNRENTYDLKKKYHNESGYFDSNSSALMTADLKDAGYDGVLYDDGINNEQVVFYPNQIKSATDNVGTFDSGNNDIRYRKDEGNFYSTVEKALDGITQEKGTKEQFRAMLQKNGAKQAELNWMDFDSLPDKVTKADIQKWINENRIEIQEVTKGKTQWVQTKENTWERKLDNQKISGRNPKEGKATISYNRFFKKYYGTTNLTKFQHTFNSLEAAKEHYDNIDGFKVDTRYHEYTLPGGENYKELLLTMPTIEQTWKTIDDFKQSMRDKYGNGWRSKMSTNENSTFEKLVSGESKRPQDDFKSSHFSERNIFAHIRFNERKANGQKVLFVEEIQSDWAQKGREYGFKDDVSPEFNKLKDEMANASEEFRAIRKERNVRLQELGVTDVYSRAWTHDEAIAGDKILVEIMEREEKAATHSESLADQFVANRIYEPLNPVVSTPFKKTDQWVSLAMRRIMKYAADNNFDRIAWTTGEQQVNRYKMDEVRKDEGMKTFYDKMLPSQVGKIAKAFGAHTETFDLGGEVGTVMSVPITDQMVEGTKEGVPLFRKHAQEIEDIKQKAIADGTFMKAPNGEVTNLNERQWLQTQTPAFKEWFGDSAVVDENGEPMVVYHGTLADFNAFRGQQMFFSVSEEFARNYSEDKAFAQGFDSDGAVMPVYLKSENLFDPKMDSHIDKLLSVLPDKIKLGFGTELTKGELGYRLQGNYDLHPKWSKDKIENAKFGRVIGSDRNGYNNDLFIGVNKNNEVVYVSHQHYEIIHSISEAQKDQLLNGERVELKGYKMQGKFYKADQLDNAVQNGEITEIQKQFASSYRLNTTITPYTAKQETQKLTNQDNWTEFELTDVDLFDKIKSLGFDGVKIQEKETSNIVVFQPNQIKSATANVGTFDSDNNDIRYRILGEKGAEALDAYDLATNRMDNLQIAKQLDSNWDQVKGMYFNAIPEAFREDAQRYIDNRDLSALARISANPEAKEAWKAYQSILAKEAKWNGLSSEERKLKIRQSTGWEKGADGKWRYEVGNETVKYPDNVEEATLADVLGRDSEILKAYPELESMEIVFHYDKDANYSGAYNSEFKFIEINHPSYKYISDYMDSIEENKKLIDTYKSEDGIIAAELSTGLKGEAARQEAIKRAKESISRSEQRIEKQKQDAMNDRSETIMHEIQHAIQDKEGFAKGGNTLTFELMVNKMEKDISDQVDDYFKMRRNVSTSAGRQGFFIEAHSFDLLGTKHDIIFYDEIIRSRKASQELKDAAKQLKEIQKMVIQPYIDLRERRGGGWQLYQDLAGEVEARNAARRMNMTPAEMRNTLLESTEDVSREDQVVIRRGLSHALSLSEPMFRMTDGTPQKPIYNGEALSEYAERMTKYNEEMRYRFSSPDIPKPPVLHAGMTWLEMSDAIALFKGNTTQVFKDINTEMNKIHKLHTEFIDRAKPLEKVLQEMEKKGAILSPATNAYLDYMTSSSKATRLTQVYNKTRIEPLQKTLRELVKSGKLDKLPAYRWEIMDRATGEVANNKPITRFERIGLYLQAKDILDAAQIEGAVDRGKKGFAENVRDEGGTGVSALQYVTDFEAAVGTDGINEIWDRVRAVNQFALDLQLEYGLITQEVYDEYTQGRKHYVPQRGWRERDLNDRAYHYVNDISGTPDNPYNSALVKAKGRSTLAGDPLAYMQSIGESSIASAMKNQTKQKFLEFAETNSDFAGKHDWFGFKHVYYIATGQRDADGNMLYERTYEPPTQEQLDEDKVVQEKLRGVRTQMQDSYNQLNAGQKTLKQHEAAMTKLRTTEKGLQNLIQVKYTDSEASRIAQVTAKERGQHTVVTLKKGKEYEIVFSENYGGERVANILNRNFGGKMNTELDLEGIVKNNMSKATRAMSALMTQYNPSFAATNAVRDWGTALISNLSEFGFEYTLNTQKNLVSPKMQAAVWQYVASDQFGDGEGFSDTYHGNMLREFFEDGSATGWSFLKDIDQLRTDMKKAIDPTTKDQVLDGTFGLKNAFGLKQAFGVLTEVSELNTRFAQYLTSREVLNPDGTPKYTREEAASHAKEITVNFDRRGNNRFFSSMFSFFNAQLQGTNKMYRMVKDPKVRNGLITITSAMLVGGMLQAMLQPDPDDEDNRAFTEWEQMTNFCFGNVKIPLPQGFRAFWGAGTQIGLAAKRQKSIAESLIDGTDFFLGELLPEQFVFWMNGFEIDERNGNLTYNTKLAARGAIPTAGQPAFDVAANTTFMGGTSYRTEFTNKLHDTKSERTLGKYNVSEGAQWISDQLFKMGGGDLGDSSKLKSDQVSTVQGIWDLNPSAIETLFSGYGGGTGKFVIDMITLAKQAADPEKEIDVSRMQVFNTFWKQPREYTAFDNEVRVLQKRTDYYKNQHGQIKKDNPEAYQELIKMNTGENGRLKRQNPDAWERMLEDEGTKGNKMFNLTKESEMLLKQIEMGNVDKRQIKEQVEYLNEQYEKLR